MAIPVDGVYKVETAMDGNFWDIQGASVANRANLYLHSSNSGNNQKFLMKTVGSYKQFIANHSGKVIEAYGTLTAKKANISQYTSNGGNNQKWTLEETTDSTGEACYAIRSAMNASYVVDAQGADNDSGDNIFLHPYNGGDNQKWTFDKTCFYDVKMGVPAGVGLASESDGTKSTSVSIRGTQRLYPVWTGQSGAYQLRYRIRGRQAGTDTWDTWGMWTSPTGSTLESGWDNTWAQTGSVTGSSATKYHTPGIDFTLDQVTYDKLEVQVEVRRFNATGSAVYGPTIGGSATGTIKISYKPVVTVSDISLAPDGLRVPYLSDFQRDPNKLDFTLSVDGKALVTNYQVTQMGYDDTVLIPYNKLEFIPNDGDTCSISCKLSTIDGDNYASETISTIGYTVGHGSEISPTFEAMEGYAESVDLGEHSSSALYLVISERGKNTFAVCDEISSGIFAVIPPIGVEYQVFCVTQDASDIWATALINRPPISAGDFYIWNYDRTYTILKLDVDFQHSVDRDHEVFMTTGRDTEVVAFGNSSSVPLSVTGSVVPSANIAHANYEDFERLALANYATFRMPLGGWYRVAITSISNKMTWSKYKDITVSMREVS